MPRTEPFGNYWDYCGGYIGIVPVFFLIAGCVLNHLKLKKDFIFFFTFFIIFLLLNIGAWPVLLIGHLPFFNHAGSNRWASSAYSFSLICAATYGFYFIQYNVAENQSWKKLIKYILITISIIIYICILPTTNQ